MTTKVTSIAGARSAARRHVATAEVNTRLTVLFSLAVGLLLVIGLGAMRSASSVVGLEQEGNGWAFFTRQLMAMGFGAVAMVVAARVPYAWYRKAAVPIFLVSSVGLLAVLLVGDRDYGSQRWIDLGFTEFQPSEFAKFATIVALAAVMAKKERRLDDVWHFVVPVATIVGSTCLFVMLEPDLGTTLIIAAAAFAILAVSASPLRYVTMTGIVGAISALVLAYASDYRFARVTAFLDPYADELGDGYQVLQGLGALGTGGTFGVGLGASRTRWGWVPNAHTDFIFAIIGEEIGFAGGLVIVTLFALIAVIGLTVAFRAPDRFGRFLAVGITVWITAQAVVNIGGVVQAMPITGMPLPFISFGGTALVMVMGAAGVLINVARSGVSSSRRGSR
ncbi:MAG TPA: putative lipid II flippase FtsW [Acidimicrobiia bacterium]|nr:putative lipid II flippase FtsW [Acidimicrobiia bacterium]